MKSIKHAHLLSYKCPSGNGYLVSERKVRSGTILNVYQVKAAAIRINQTMLNHMPEVPKLEQM